MLVITHQHTSGDVVGLGALALDPAAHSGRRTPVRRAILGIGLCLMIGPAFAHAQPEPADEPPRLAAADGVQRERAAQRRRAAQRKRAKSSSAKSTLAVILKEDRASDDPTKPSRWLPSNGPECIKRGRLRGFCEGPRRVPEPHGESAQLAQRLGMGERNKAARLLVGPPPERWVEVAGAIRQAKWRYPVDDSRLLRGLGNVARLGKNKQGGGPRGTRRKPHAGLDIGAAEGAPIRAAQSGVVVYSDNRISGYGNLVMVVHRDASVALYGHCRSTYVFPGQQVQRGQIIAEVGHTGYARGSHLHFEYRVEGRPKDPTRLFDQ
jgi:murein DD-endopeptidase MepM/ murein hydrolase activator NlpD